MALLTKGYWSTTYWPSNYWVGDYWPEYVPVPGKFDPFFDPLEQWSKPKANYAQTIISGRSRKVKYAR